MKVKKLKQFFIKDYIQVIVGKDVYGTGGADEYYYAKNTKENYGWIENKLTNWLGDNSVCTLFEIKTIYKTNTPEGIKIVNL